MHTCIWTTKQTLTILSAVILHASYLSQEEYKEQLYCSEMASRQKYNLSMNIKHTHDYKLLM